MGWWGWCLAGKESSAKHKPRASEEMAVAGCEWEVEDGDTGWANLDVSKAQPSSGVLSWSPVGSEQRNSMGAHPGMTVTRHLAISACGNPLGNVDPRAEDPSWECIWYFGLSSLLFSPRTPSRCSQIIYKSTSSVLGCVS